MFERCKDPGIGILNADEQQVVNILTVTAEGDTELTYYKNLTGWVHANRLFGSHFRVLAPCGWLSDEIVNAYGK